MSLAGHEVKPDDLQEFHCLKKKDTVIAKINVGSRNTASLLTKRASVVNQMFSPNLIFLVGSSFWRARITKTIKLEIKLIYFLAYTYLFT